MNGKLLPIGSVVLLKDAKKRLMITGYYMYDKSNNNKIYDYCGCIFPEGLMKMEEIPLFNHSQIEKIYFLGLQDTEVFGFMKKLKDFASNKLVNHNDTNELEKSNEEQDKVASLEE